ncbi:hypothetical protein CIB48_g5827 [Xylaria polymorpha]|nr:hypothetical protein CIB48_g5827 [Xylaria polymorpha]
MCIKTYLHFTKCDHVVTTLTSCPTHHKQQQSTKGLFGCIFGRNLRNKKNCGKVIPHHHQAQTYCQACLVQKDHFTAQGVGHGALKVRKQGFQEIFHEENKEAARIALQKAEKRRRHGEKSNHNIIHTQTSVWLTDLYHHPETLARKEAYAREAARAPPVSSHHRTESRSRAARPSSGKRTQGRHAGERRQTESSREWMPAYGYSQPMIRPTRPAPTYPYSSRSVNRAPSLPPAGGHFPYIPQDNRSFVARAEAAGLPDLRRKTGNTHNTTRSRDEQPAPLRQANGKPEAAQAKKHPSTPREIVHYGPRPYWERNPSRWEARKASISSWIERLRPGKETHYPSTRARIFPSFAKPRKRSATSTGQGRKTQSSTINRLRMVELPSFGSVIIDRIEFGRS